MHVLYKMPLDAGELTFLVSSEVMIGDSRAATEARVVVIPFRTPANLGTKENDTISVIFPSNIFSKMIKNNSRFTYFSIN